MASYSAVVAVPATKVWTLVADGKATVFLSADSPCDVAVADSQADLDLITRGMRIGPNSPVLRLDGLGTKDVFVKSATATKVAVTAY